MIVQPLQTQPRKKHELWKQGGGGGWYFDDGDINVIMGMQ